MVAKVGCCFVADHAKTMPKKLIQVLTNYGYHTIITDIQSIEIEPLKNMHMNVRIVNTMNVLMC